MAKIKNMLFLIQVVSKKKSLYINAFKKKDLILIKKIQLLLMKLQKY